MKNIVNIINFVRGIEPRPGRNIDLVGTVKNQIAQMRKHNLNGTFLLQYDAITDGAFVKMLKDSEFELGLWMEVVKDQVEAVGESWRGRFPWDWHNDVGFLIGYTPSVREKLIDEHMSKFHEVFGYYPKSIGSWHIDAHSLNYLSEKYEIDASCNCRDQVGTDGYTMQGAYYNGAYYPSKTNMFCVGHGDNQINIPVFRMLGSDAIYAYDYQVKKEDYGIERIPTLEPASLQYGGNAEWIASFMRTTFCGHGITHQYTQAGQENSFGWQRFGPGFMHQMRIIRELADAGKIEVMTLGDAGRWYKQSFENTPPQALTALDDHLNGRYKSVWYSCKNYRANLFWDDGTVRIRDMYIYSDTQKEPHLESPCQTTACEFRASPVIDGVLYGKDSGAYIGNIKWDTLHYTEGDTSATVTLKNSDAVCTVTFDEDGITVCCDADGFEIAPKYQKDLVYGKPADSTALFCSRNNSETVISSIEKVTVTDAELDFTFRSNTYGIRAIKGSFTPDIKLIPQNGQIQIKIKNGI